jgi:hypothetical protein
MLISRLRALEQFRTTHVFTIFESPRFIYLISPSLVRDIVPLDDFRFFV